MRRGAGSSFTAVVFVADKRVVTKFSVRNSSYASGLVIVRFVVLAW